ncbi:hypothetical protein GFS31_34020 [Leptolyngbya sp. BL0902]|uniref:hypothetical protein n=1 Tax=Leptolyngbya sp. BL0902 TaxID=1115757 RepID=UPI0018E7A687|nr:hypothetical protein [Leptolyngbya sp. BL0902]QQE66702.1 hypothetical protein GFS31_34020 [Leptolyngbya sp. BL0902]
MTTFNITSEELSEALEITIEKLFDICDFFDSDPDDDWNLVEGVDFRWGVFKTRLFSPEGAVAICNYLEINKKERPMFKRWERWLLQRDAKLKGLMVAKRIQEISSRDDGEIIYQNSKAFFSPRACREVLGIGKRQDLLQKTFRKLLFRKDGIEPPKPGTDFLESKRIEEIESMNTDDLHKLCSNEGIKWRNVNEKGKNLNKREIIDKIVFTLRSKDKNQESYVLKDYFFSGSGLASISKSLEIELTQEHRKAWMEAVHKYAQKAISVIEDHEQEREKRIKVAMDRVKSNARGYCQITNRRQSIHKFNLEVHHLFDKNHYPKLADLEVNLIAIASDTHKHFHQWMGGCHTSCTIEDMERYIAEFSGSLFQGGDAVEQSTKVAIKLSSAKKALKSYL